MRPLKATLLFFYVLTALAAIGTSFSYFWRLNKRLAMESRYFSSAASLRAPAPNPVIEPKP